MKNRKLAQRILPIAGMITLVTGCASTNDLYEKYEDVCELPKGEIVERTKIVKEIVEKDRIVEKVKLVDKIKYVDRVKRVMVPQTKVVEKIKVVNKTQYVDKMVSGSIWEPAVYFGYDLASLDANELARLDRDIVVLKKNPKLKLSVQAFTDSHGSNQYNQKLALQRQKTVVDYLVSKGVTRNRIVLSPLGEELPILGNSAAERVVNRRVELMLLDQGGRPLSFAIQPKATDFKAPFPVK